MRDMKAHRYDRWKAFRKRKKKAQRREQMERDAEVTKTYGRAAHSQCGRKMAYESKDEAISVAAHYARRKYNIGVTLRAYECPYCGQWHLTSH